MKSKTCTKHVKVHGNFHLPSCTSHVKVHGNFHVPCNETYGKVHGNFHVPCHMFACEVHGNFHVPFSETFDKVHGNRVSFLGSGDDVFSDGLPLSTSCFPHITSFQRSTNVLVE